MVSVTGSSGFASLSSPGVGSNLGSLADVYLQAAEAIGLLEHCAVAP